MKKISIYVLAFAITIGLATTSYALTILSGDSNLATVLTASSYGNDDFFINILQGGSSVAVLEATVSGISADTHIHSFYDGLSGVSSTLISGDITDAVLAGVDLFAAPVPDDAFSTSELLALNNFNSGGGTTFFLGDHSGSDMMNEYINEALAYLGSSMSILYDSTFDSEYHEAVGDKIVSDPLTVGVTSLRYAAPSQISGGTTLFYGTNYEPFLAYEDVGSPIPEPTTMFLMGTGLAGLAGIRRKLRR